MTSDAEAAASRRLEASLSTHGLRDFRQVYRKLLVELREGDESAYEEAVARYRRDLLPALCREGTDPLQTWIRYGMEIASAVTPGRAVAVDSTGRCGPVEGEPPTGALVLHLPEDRRRSAVLLAEPADPSDPQQATLELLIR